MRLILIGCSKTKLPQPEYKDRRNNVLPKDFYGGQLFQKRVAYAERLGIPWMVLSAKYGLWKPDRPAVPYDQEWGGLDSAEKAIWHVTVACKLMEELWEPYHKGEQEGPLSPSELTVEIHAGSDYCHPLADILRLTGVKVELPCAGLGIGQQLAAYTSGDLSADPEAQPDKQDWSFRMILA